MRKCIAAIAVAGGPLSILRSSPGESV